jgi:hypothetical protein
MADFFTKLEQAGLKIKLDKIKLTDEYGKRAKAMDFEGLAKLGEEIEMLDTALSILYTHRNEYSTLAQGSQIKQEQLVDILHSQDADILRRIKEETQNNIKFLERKITFLEKFNFKTFIERVTNDIVSEEKLKQSNVKIGEVVK